MPGVLHTRGKSSTQAGSRAGNSDTSCWSLPARTLASVGTGYGELSLAEVSRSRIVGRPRNRSAERGPARVISFVLRAWTVPARRNRGVVVRWLQSRLTPGALALAQAIIPSKAGCPRAVTIPGVGWPADAGRRSRSPHPAARPATTGTPCARAGVSPCASCCARSACDRIGGHRGRRRHVGQRPAVRSPELERAVGLSLDLIALLVHRAVVPATEQREVRERRRARRAPSGGCDAPAPNGTPQPGKRQPWSRWCSARRNAGGIVRVRAPTSTTRPSVVVAHHHPARVARQALRRFRGNARAVLEHRLARADPDPPAPRRRRGPPPGSARPARRDRARGASAVSASRASASACCCAMVGRSATGSADGSSSACDPGPLVQRLAGGVERLQEQRAHLRRQPPADHHHAVLVLIDVERPARVLALGLPRLGLAIHPPPAAHDALDVRGRAGAPHREQPLFGLRRGDAGQGADLGVRQLPAGERLRQPRQRRRGRAPRGPARGRRPRSRPTRQREPLGAGAEAVVPAAAGVELADEVEQARGGGVEVRRQLGDLVAEPVQLRDACWSGSRGRDGRVDLHGESPFYWGDSTPGFRSRPGALRTRDAGTSDDFSFGPARPPSTGPVRAAGPASTERSRHSSGYRAGVVKRRMRRARITGTCGAASA